MSYVSHIAVFNDVTARDMQNEYRKRGDAWSLAKGMDTFGPVSDFVPAKGVDVNNLHLTLKVNGEIRQDGYTSDMIFPPAKLISYVSRYMTIEEGDIMATGTPEGVGEIVPGDVVELEIEGLCKLRNKVV
jgi:acylpyruvate hydrolase